ncbi:MAG: hypothetical protein K2K84_00805 [Muribaculaceae bacterium]|nr:hypothetical protein [Muribaculaceae bacterium]
MKNLFCKKIIVALFSFTLIILFATSCKEEPNPESLLTETMKEINGKDNGYDDFEVIHNDSFFCILHKLESTDENKAKILWLGNDENLGKKFRTEIIDRLKEGNILKRVVKERKTLILGVYTDDIEYHVVIPPAELIHSVLKK